MNYISHLNNFFARIIEDQRLSPLHISLYLALFHYWNVHRFDNPFPVYRADLMRFSKIGSKNTYHKCIRELHRSGYIQYYPAPFKYLPVAISMIRLDGEVGKDVYQQLDMFHHKGAGKEGAAGIGNDTGHVPELTVAGTTNDTRQVSKVVLLYKHINFKQLNSECVTPTKKINKKSGDKKKASTYRDGPTLEEVETFFRQHNYPPAEAQKFFYYNEGKAWMIGPKLPVTDWQSIAHKWMLNTKTQKQNNNDRTQYLHTPRHKNYSEPL